MFYEGINNHRMDLLLWMIKHVFGYECGIVHESIHINVQIECIGLEDLPDFIFYDMDKNVFRQEFKYKDFSFNIVHVGSDSYDEYYFVDIQFSWMDKELYESMFIEDMKFSLDTLYDSPQPIF